MPRRSEKTGKPLPPIQWIWHPCRSCGQLTAVPLGVKGYVGKNAGTCPFCGGKR